MHKVVIAGAVRTAIGSFNGALAPLACSDLGAIVIKEALSRSGITPANVDTVVMGNVLQAAQGQGPVRQAALKAGLSKETPAYSLNIICGSGLKSVILGARAIKLGDAQVVVAGGMESMSNAPYALDKARTGYRMGDSVLVDTMIRDSLTDAFENTHMGITAENVAAHYGISREEQDAFALASQQKAAKALADGVFSEEIVPVVIPNKKGDIVFSVDEYPRATTAEALAKLRPAFKKDGTVTAGNASGINDGAAALVLMSEEAAKRLGAPIQAYVTGYGTGGVEPSMMGMGPVPAVKKVLAAGGLASADAFDLIEANEAFAAQALAVGKELKFPADRVNVHGGAIALGHPVGASGARILVTLLHSLRRAGLKRGLATLCVGGGMGVALAVERA